MMDDPLKIVVMIALVGMSVWFVSTVVRWIRLEIRLANLEEEDDDDVDEVSEVEIPQYGPCVDKAFVKWKERNPEEVDP